jgi:hypothetical protein
MIFIKSLNTYFIKMKKLLNYYFKRFFKTYHLQITDLIWCSAAAVSVAGIYFFWLGA